MTKIVLRQSEASAAPASQANPLDSLASFLVTRQTLDSHVEVMEAGRNATPPVWRFPTQHFMAHKDVYAAVNSDYVLARASFRQTSIRPEYNPSRLTQPGLGGLLKLIHPSTILSSAPEIRLDGEPIAADGAHKLPLMEILDYVLSGVGSGGGARLLDYSYPALNLMRMAETPSLGALLGEDFQYLRSEGLLPQLAFRRGGGCFHGKLEGIGGQTVSFRHTAYVRSEIRNMQRFLEGDNSLENAGGLFSIGGGAFTISTRIPKLNEPEGVIRTYHNSKLLRKYVRYARKLVSAALADRFPLLGVRIFLMRGQEDGWFLRFEIHFGPAFISPNPDTKYKATLLTSCPKGQWLWLGQPASSLTAGGIQELLDLYPASHGLHPVAGLWGEHLLKTISPSTRIRSLAGPLQAISPQNLGGTSVEVGNISAPIGPFTQAQGESLGMAPCNGQLIAVILAEEDVAKSSRAQEAESIHSDHYPATCRVAPTAPARHALGGDSSHLIFTEEGLGGYISNVPHYLTGDVRSSRPPLHVYSVAPFLEVVMTTLERRNSHGNWIISSPVV